MAAPIRMFAKLLSLSVYFPARLTLFRQVSVCAAHRPINFISRQTDFNFTQTYASKCVSTKVQKIRDEEPDELYRQVDLELKGHEDAVLRSYVAFLQMAANELGVFIANVYTPMMVYDRMTVLKSAFVHKKHRVQYEMRTHYRVVRLKHLTGSTCDTYLEYIERNLPAGMAMKVTRHKLETLAEHLTPPPNEQLEHSDQSADSNLELSEDNEHMDSEEFVHSELNDNTHGNVGKKPKQ